MEAQQDIVDLLEEAMRLPLSTLLATSRLFAGTMRGKSEEGSSRSEISCFEGPNQPRRSTNSPPWEGPYTMTEVIRSGTYRLKDDNGDVLTNTWNIEQLNRFFPKNSVLPLCFIQCLLLQSTPARTLSARVAQGLHGGAIPPLFFTII